MRLRPQKKIYLDFAAAAPLSRSAKEAVKEALSLGLGNPSSIHAFGTQARKVLETARKELAGILDAHADEVIFTGSGTESIALSIMGTVFAAKKDFPANPPADGRRLPHIVTTTIEHSAVLETCRLLAERGEAEISYLRPDDEGRISATKVAEAINENTVLVSIHAVNSEIGVQQPVAEYIKVLNRFKEKKYALESMRLVSKPFYPYLHIDACQAFAHVELAVLVRKGIDLISFNSVKIGGPAGIAGLYRRRHLLLGRLYGGGDQEFGLRPGTTAPILAHAFAAAAKELALRLPQNELRYQKLKALLLKGLASFSREEIYFIENSNQHSVPSIVSLSFPYLSGQQMAIELDARNLAVSSKSACKSEYEDESYVVEELRKIEDNVTYQSFGTIRISFGPATAESDIQSLLQALKDIAALYRGVLY